MRGFLNMIKKGFAAILVLTMLFCVLLPSAYADDKYSVDKIATRGTDTTTSTFTVSDTTGVEQTECAENDTVVIRLNLAAGEVVDTLTACQKNADGSDGTALTDPVFDEANNVYKLTMPKSAAKIKLNVKEDPTIVHYGLFVNNVEVTSFNKTNVLNDTGATVAYDPAAKQLTLNGAHLTSVHKVHEYNDYNDYSAPIIVSNTFTDTELKIRVLNESDIVVAPGAANLSAMMLPGVSVEISGAPLNVIVPTCTNDTAVYVRSLTVSNCFSVTADSASYATIGIQCSGTNPSNFTIKDNGEVNITILSNSNAIQSENIGLYVYDNITVPVNGTLDIEVQNAKKAVGILVKHGPINNKGTITSKTKNTFAGDNFALQGDQIDNSGTLFLDTGNASGGSAYALFPRNAPKDSGSVLSINGGTVTMSSGGKACQPVTIINDAANNHCMKYLKSDGKYEVKFSKQWNSSMPEFESRYLSFFPDIPASSITVETEDGETSGTIDLSDADKTLQLVAEILPEGAPQAVIWSSSDSTVASVDANGLVTGIKKSDTPVEITATSAYYSDVSKALKVTVKDSGALRISIVGDSPSASIYDTQSLKFNATIESEEVASDYTPAWVFSDGTTSNEYASIDATGLLTPKKPTSTPLVVYAYIEEEPTVVCNNPKQVTILDCPDATLTRVTSTPVAISGAGKKIEVSVSVPAGSPSGALDYALSKLTWESSDTKIVKVTSGMSFSDQDSRYCWAEPVGTGTATVTAYLFKGTTHQKSVTFTVNSTSEGLKVIEPKNRAVWYYDSPTDLTVKVNFTDVQHVYVDNYEVAFTVTNLGNGTASVTIPKSQLSSVLPKKLSTHYLRLGQASTAWDACALLPIYDRSVKDVPVTGDSDLSLYMLLMTACVSAAGAIYLDRKNKKSDI